VMGADAVKTTTARERRPIPRAWAQSADESELRQTGLDPIGAIPWGTHLCMFYETPQDLLEAVLPYFRIGLENQECCIWAVSAPLSEEDAVRALRAALPPIESVMASGQLEIVRGADWYQRDGKIEPGRIVALWDERIRTAMARGFRGVRASGNTLWHRLPLWDDFQEYERTLEDVVAHRPIIFLCTYRIEKSLASDVLDVANSHQCIIARRNHAWEFLDAPGNAEAKKELSCLNCDREPVTRRSSLRSRLTAREQVVLAQIIKGQSSKQIARTLHISPRTVDFHRANLMSKLGAKNAPDLVRLALAAE